MKATGKDLIKQVLKKWRFPVIRENETGVLFRYQMSYIEAKAYGDEESDAVSLILKGSFAAENEIEEAAALKTCNHLSRDLFHIKLYLDNENKLEVASEFFYRPEDDMEYLMNMGLKTLVLGKKRFLEEYRAIEVGTNFLTNLEISKYFSDNHDK